MHVARHRGVGADHQRVTVGRRPRDEGGAYIAAAARPVVDDHRLPPGLMQAFADGARGEIGYRARRVADHDGDGFGRIGLCARNSRHEQARQANESGALNVQNHYFLNRAECSHS
jgi:hypothetical protein